MSRINQPIEAVDLQIYFSILFKTGKPFFSIARFTTQILVIMSTIARLCCFVIKIRRNWKKYRACVWYFIRSCFKSTSLFNVCTNIPRHYSAEHWAVVRSIIIPGLERYSRRKRERERVAPLIFIYLFTATCSSSVLLRRKDHRQGLCDSSGCGFLHSSVGRSVFCSTFWVLCREEWGTLPKEKPSPWYYVSIQLNCNQNKNIFECICWLDYVQRQRIFLKGWSATFIIGCRNFSSLNSDHNLFTKRCEITRKTLSIAVVTTTGYYTERLDILCVGT